MAEIEYQVMESNKDKYFKGQQSNETLICFFRHHWVVMLREFIFFTIFLFVVSYSLRHINAIQEVLRGEYELKLLFGTAYIANTIYLHRFFIKLLNFFVNVCIITDTRIIDHKKTLFFTDSMDAIDLAQVQNIEKVQEGLMPSLLKYGNIKIFLTASDAVMTFHAVPNPRFHFRCISRQKESRQNAVMREHGGNVSSTPITEVGAKVSAESNMETSTSTKETKNS